MYRVVLDANQLVSAFLRRDGIPAQVLELFRKGVFEVVTSPSIVKEIQTVLNYPRLQKYHAKTNEEISRFLSLFADICINIDITKKAKTIIKDDPTDDKYLLCAIKGKADFVISGDKHLLKLSSYKDIKVLTPREFLKILGK